MPAKIDFDADLIMLGEDKIAKEPLEIYGRKWAEIVGQDGLAAQFGVVTKTLSRRLAKPPFKRRVKRLGLQVDDHFTCRISRRKWVSQPAAFGGF